MGTPLLSATVTRCERLRPLAGGVATVGPDDRDDRRYARPWRTLSARPRGPLTGVRIVEIAGLGAGPFCGMMLADMGADVVRVDRPTTPSDGGVLGRNRRSIALDLKADSGRSLLFELIRRADGLVEAFRPGVAERLGFGPEACHAENPRLVFGRATGWGQQGPWHMMAGHDIDYIALSGVLSMIGPEGGAPVPPLNLVGDFGGGGLLLAFGMVCALLETRTSGVGQVVDGAMVDGSALLATMFFEMSGRDRWSDDRGTNVLDGGAPYYDTYETSDGKWVAVGAVESQFWGFPDRTAGHRRHRAPRQGRRNRLAPAPPTGRGRHRHPHPRGMG